MKMVQRRQAYAHMARGGGWNDAVGSPAKLGKDLLNLKNPNPSLAHRPHPVMVAASNGLYSSGLQAVGGEGGLRWTPYTFLAHRQSNRELELVSEQLKTAFQSSHPALQGSVWPLGPEDTISDSVLDDVHVRWLTDVIAVNYRKRIRLVVGDDVQVRFFDYNVGSYLHPKLPAYARVHRICQLSVAIPGALPRYIKTHVLMHTLTSHTYADHTFPHTPTHTQIVVMGVAAILPEWQAETSCFRSRDRVRVQGDHDDGDCM